MLEAVQLPVRSLQPSSIVVSTPGHAPSAKRARTLRTELASWCDAVELEVRFRSLGESQRVSIAIRGELQS